MYEALLQYIWQFQYFQKNALVTTAEQPITVLAPGTPNRNAGPDFLDARMRIGEIDWVGNVEIHIKTSAWYGHGHDADPAYDNVILHVVWQQDKPVLRSNGEPMPTLTLQERVDPAFIDQYHRFIANPLTIPCASNFNRVQRIIKLSMVEKAAIYRLERKAAAIAEQFRANKNDWEETTYQLVAQNFGFKTNAEPFYRLACSVSLKTLLKHGDRIDQIEALLFGQSGLLETVDDGDYIDLLKREYNVLARKYNLEQHRLAAHIWKFMRMRPANFPTVRLAQLAALIGKTRSLFSKMITIESYADLRTLFLAPTSPYWRKHYRFSIPADYVPSRLGRSSVENVIINTVAPLLVSYGKAENSQHLVDRALFFLQQTPAEINQITKKWSGMGLSARSALESQGLIELSNGFCAPRKCLQCAIGASILQPATK